MGAKQFGARVARVEDPSLLTGRARFVDDIKLPGMQHGCFLRSPHPHARIRSIHTAKALAVPGVRAVLTARDMPGRLATEPIPTPVPNPAITAMRTQRALACEEVCYVGEAIALVVADNRYVAEDAADAIVADFERLNAVNNCCAGLDHGAARSHSDLTTNVAAVVPMSYGDVNAAFAGAAHVFEEEIFQHRGAAMTLEGRAVLADYDEAADLLTVWSATQTPHICQRTIADLLERELPSVRVIAPFVGGGFGTKAPFYSEEIVIPVAAMTLGRPVKWIEDRREHFLSATMERDQYWKVSIAVDRDGRIRGLRGTMIHDNGAYLPWGIIAPYIAATTFPGPYVVPAFRFEATVVLTNRVPTTVVRGAGRPQAVFAMERLMDRVARELGLDRAEVRRRNMVQPEQMPYSVGLVFRDGKPLIYASGDFPKSQDRALVLADYEGFRARQTKARAGGRYLGIGIGNYVEGTGLGPFEGVTVRVLPNGKVAVATGATTQGQGTRTTLSQIVALAARVLGVPESDIDVEDGRATARTGNKPSMSLGELARVAQGMPGVCFAAGQTPGLEHTAYFTPLQASYCNGTHVAEVEVDPMTGGVRLLDYTVAHDSGNIINPLIVDGQVQGGVAHGIGNALFEWMKY